jgi:hypothetical protein
MIHREVRGSDIGSVLVQLMAATATTEAVAVAVIAVVFGAVVGIICI